MISAIDITGPVGDIDPQGFLLVAGIIFSFKPTELPCVGQLVKIVAVLEKMPPTKEEKPVWTITSMTAFDQTKAMNANPPVEVPHQTAHHINVNHQPAKTHLTPPSQSTTPSTPPQGKPAAQAGRFGGMNSLNSRNTPASTSSSQRPAFVPATPKEDAFQDEDIPF